MEMAAQHKVGEQANLSGIDQVIVSTDYQGRSEEKPCCHELVPVHAANHNPGRGREGEGGGGGARAEAKANWRKGVSVGLMGSPHSTYSGSLKAFSSPHSICE